MSSPAISEDIIKKIAHLARLELDPDEVKLYSQQLGAILDYVSQLSKVDTEHVQPMVTATEMNPTIAEDQVIKTENPELLTDNAPDKSGNLFKVPAVL